GLVLLLLLALLFPGCLGGPYAALDPWLRTHWMDRIAEALPLWRSLLDNTAYTVALAVPPLLALLVAAWRPRQEPGPGRSPWLLYALFLALAVLVMLLQVRGARMAASL